MIEILKFNFKRVINKWYFFILITLLGHAIYIITDITSVYYDDQNLIDSISMFTRAIWIQITNIIFLFIFIYFLYKDYKSGIWNYIIGTNGMSPLKIIFSYIANALLIIFFSILFYSLWSTIIYWNNIKNYGIFKWINDIFIKHLIFITLVFSICILIFILIPTNLEVIIIFFIFLIFYSFYLETLIFMTIDNIQKSTNIPNLIISFIPLINLSFLYSSNSYFYVAITFNLIFILITFCIIMWLEKRIKLWK